MFKYMFKQYILMKTITVTDEAYEKLKKMKSEGDSFTDAILKLPEKKLTISELFGVLKDSGNIEEDRKRLKQIHDRIGKDMEKRRNELGIR